MAKEDAMLFALDIDGTIATSGNWFARWMTGVSGLNIADDQLARIEYGVDWWQLPAVRALSHERRVELRSLAHAHHKDLPHLENRVPIPGAQDALWMLNDSARIIYTTCRPQTSAQLTREWLKRCGFPNAEQVYTCDLYHEKFIHAHSQATTAEPVIVIDDQISKLVPAFRTLVKEDRTIGVSLILRIMFVQIGQDEPPPFPPIPFPVLACPSWQRADVSTLLKTADTFGTRVQA
jgi:hypothetical protein